MRRTYQRHHFAPARPRSRSPLPGERVSWPGNEGTFVLEIPSRDLAIVRDFSGEEHRIPLEDVSVVDGG